MTNVVRLVNGGAIQVRTGVIQGIGPQGPQGVSGPQGIDGEQGPVGAQGPMGQINQLQGKTNISANNPLSANTDTLLAWGSVSYDDLSCFTSTSNITLTAAGDYMLSAWVRFDDAASTIRELWFATGGTIIARSSRTALAGSAFYANLAFPFRAAGGEVITALARTGTATGISLGSMCVTRMGSGPPGPTGPAGPAGAQGVAGPTGAAGPAGSASTGFATYALILPH